MTLKQWHSNDRKSKINTNMSKTGNYLVINRICVANKSGVLYWRVAFQANDVRGTVKSGDVLPFSPYLMKPVTQL